MYEIDHFAILFILSPLAGNFIFGNLKNKYEFRRYQEQAPNEKVLNYVSRMMYLPDGAKEIRLSKVFELMKKQYKDATDKNVKVAIKYAFANCSLSFLRITFTFTVIFEGVLLYAIYRNRVSESITLAQLTIMTSLMVAMTWILIRVFENIMESNKDLDKKFQEFQKALLALNPPAQLRLSFFSEAYKEILQTFTEQNKGFTEIFAKTGKLSKAAQKTQKYINSLTEKYMKEMMKGLR